MSRTAIAVSVLACALLIAPIARTQPNNANVAPGRFICLVDDGEDAFAIGQRAVKATGGTLGHVYTHALKGFSIGVPPGIVIANLRAQKGVIHAEPDLIMHTCADPIIPTGVDRIDAEGVAGSVDCSGVGIAIIDTGIDVDHPDLNVQDAGVRYYLGGTGPPWRRTVTEDDNFDDDAGHGTHCAGIAAANGGIVGVAPGARLYAVKVLDSSGSGYISAIAAGIDWVAAKAVSLDIQVANMSLGGQGESEVLYNAIAGCSSVTFTVSAGNDGKDIYGPDGVYGGGDDFIPAAYGGALVNVLTISALADSDGEPGGHGGPTSYGVDDSFASFSNYSAEGQIDYILPGVDIYSTYMGGGYATMSGTSMASPHAAGLIALGIAGGNVFAVAQDDETYGLVNGGDPDAYLEPLYYAGYPGEPSGNLDPTANFSYDVDGLMVTFTDQSTDDVSIFSWDWDFGDGSDSDAEDPTHTYAASGTYSVMLEVTDADGARDSITKDVTVSDGSGSDIMYVDFVEMDYTKKGANFYVVTTVIVLDDLGSPAPDATVHVDTILPSGSIRSQSGLTDVDGLVEFTVKSREKGTYTSEVTRVEHDSLIWEGSPTLVSIEVP